MPDSLISVEEFVRQYRAGELPEVSTATVEVVPPDPAPAKPDFDIVGWAHDLDREFLECRVMGHRWDWIESRWDKETQTYYVTHECDRCGTLKHAYWSKVGEPLTANYTYPAGYLASPGTASAIDKTGKNGLRVEYISRVSRP